MSSVLIIDDEEALRLIVRTALGDEGFEVIEADNGMDGFDLARKHQPDLILCDVKMKGLDGYATLEKIREDAVTAAIPVILVTGVMTDYSSVRHAMGIGADDYLLKPFSVQDLVVAVRTRLQKQQVVVRKAESRLSELRTNLALSLPHELRTPLVSILGFADLLKTYYESMDRKEMGLMAADIHKAGTRLHRLVENYVVYAQIELMAVDENKLRELRKDRSSELQAIIKIVAGRVAADFKRGADLSLNLAGGQAAISSDNFERVVRNLVDNAFKFSTPGTGVEVTSSNEGGSFVMKVVDHGRGMTPEQIQDVGGYMQFERRLHEQQGSGLGLVIAKRLAELHGGAFTIESTPGAGTNMVVKIPAG